MFCGCQGKNTMFSQVSIFVHVVCQLLSSLSLIFFHLPTTVIIHRFKCERIPDLTQT